MNQTRVAAVRKSKAIARLSPIVILWFVSVFIIAATAPAAPVYNIVSLGLNGLEHTRDDGYSYSGAVQLNEVGQVIGESSRYNGGSTFLGSSAWLYDGATTIDIGLAGPEHTRNDGHKISLFNSFAPGSLNDAGQVIGISYRYNGGSSELGQSAWFHDGATTIDIGLTGPEHTRNDGFKSSGLRFLNETGQVLGYSSRFNGGSANLGQSAWLYDGATTIDIGLTGPEHTRNDGYKRSDLTSLRLNEVGQVVGSSARFNGGSTELGQDAWFYDPVLNQTFELNLSTRSDGYAYSGVSYLDDDGVVLGTYTLFDALDNDLGPRPFYFSVGDGLHDLGALVDGELPGNGWDYLRDAIRANGRRQIFGHGVLTSQPDGQMAYLLTPVPEPSAWVLFAVSGSMLLTARLHERLK